MENKKVFRLVDSMENRKLFGYGPSDNNFFHLMSGWNQMYDLFYEGVPDKLREEIEDDINKVWL